MAAPVITPITFGTFFPGCGMSSADFPVSNGPVTWSITAGALPTGYSVFDGFDPGTGAVGGTTSDTGTFSFTIRATNGDGFDEWATSFDVADWEVPVIDPTAPPNGSVGTYYSFSLVNTGAGADINCNDFTVVSGALPDGLVIDSYTFGGDLNGVPTTAGTFSFTVRSENPAGFDEQAFSVVITEPVFEADINFVMEDFLPAIVAETTPPASQADITLVMDDFVPAIDAETTPPPAHAIILLAMDDFVPAITAETTETFAAIDLDSIDASSLPVGPAYIELFDPDSTLDMDLPSIDGSSLPVGVVVEHYPIVEIPFQPVTTVELYDRDGVLLSALENASGVRWQDPFNDVGNGSVTLPLDDPDSALLVASTEVRCYLYGELVYAWEVDKDPNVNAIAEGEESAQDVSADGDGRVGLLGRGRIYPVKGVAAQLMGQHRLYSFASPDFPNGDTWIAATQNLRQDVLDPVRHSTVAVTVPHFFEDDTHFDADVPAPLEWMVPTAYWIWGTADTLEVGFNYFRGSFDLAVETSVEIAATADNYWTLYLDGNPILGETGTTSTWQEYKTVSLKLPAGHYTLASVVENVPWPGPAADNPAGFLCAVYTINDKKELVDTIKVSDSSWTVLAYPATVPGWTPGQILIDAIAEVQARGGLAGFLYDFTEFADSSGGPWQTTDPTLGSYVPGFSIPIGGSVLDILTSLKDQGWIDFRVKPGGLVLQMWSQGHAGHASGVTLAQTLDTATQNIVSQTFAPQGAPVTRLLVKWSQGFFQLDDGAAQTAWGVFEGYVTFDAANETEARRQAQLVLDELSDPQTAIVIHTDPAGEDDRPYLSYANGDTLTIPDRHGAPSTSKLLSITVDETDMGLPTIALEFGARVLERQREQFKLFDTLGRGVTGNTKIRIPLTETSDVSNG